MGTRKGFDAAIQQLCERPALPCPALYVRHLPVEGGSILRPLALMRPPMVTADPASAVRLRYEREPPIEQACAGIQSSVNGCGTRL